MKETRKTEADSRTGKKKMAIGHHVGIIWREKGLKWHYSLICFRGAVTHYREEARYEDKGDGRASAICQSK